MWVHASEETRSRWLEEGEWLHSLVASGRFRMEAQELRALVNADILDGIELANWSANPDFMVFVKRPAVYATNRDSLFRQLKAQFQSEAGVDMWRSLGWLFVHGWDPADMNTLYASGLVETRTYQNRRQVRIEEDADLNELRQAARYVTRKQMEQARRTEIDTDEP